MKRTERGEVDDVAMLEVVGHSMGSEGKRYRVKCQTLSTGRTCEVVLAPYG